VVAVSLDFNKNENPKKIDNKKIYIDEAKGKLEELKPKLSLVSANTNNVALVKYAAKEEPNKTSEINSLNGNIASENSTIQADKKETNTDKTVTLTVSGTGKTLEEAKTNALRSAIEQAFGAFISSKTEILNDNLVKDEIVSVTNGNIQKFEIVSQVEVPNIGYAITLSATVSILKLTSFAESKGVEVEFKGGMFAQNIKLQKLNEQSEEKAIRNLVEVYLQLLENSFDYSLVSSEPVLVSGQSEVYKINFTVKTIVNDNYNKFINYFKETLSKVQVIDEEATNFIKVGKPIYNLIIDNIVYKFRSLNSFHYIEKFFICSQLLATSFKVNSNVRDYKYSFRQIYRPTSSYYASETPNLLILNSRIVNNFEIKASTLTDIRQKYFGSLFPFFIENKNPYESISNLFTTEICPLFVWQYYNLSEHNKKIYDEYEWKKEKYNYLRRDEIFDIDNGTIYFSTEFMQTIFEYSLNFNLSELEKITSFKIEKIPFLEYINDLNNYVELE
jgi:hypothetical protein